MFPTPNYTWVCENCAYEVGGFKDENDIISLIADSPSCPNCKIRMKEKPPIRTPSPASNPFKKY